MIKHLTRAALVSFVLAALPAAEALAATAYDGGWSLTFITKRGPGCDPSYNFSVQIINGIVSHANLVKFKGRVSRGGGVTASVSVPGKFASGTGRLSRTDGRGRWSGYSGKARCSGVWTAQKY